ncbi:MAG: helix-turn-helix domain-containing protein, partial [Priestia megaterium]
EELKKCQQYIQANNQVMITIGVGKPAEQFNLHASYEEAKKALKVASKRQTVVFYEELLMDMMLEDVSEPVKKEFLSRVLSSIQKEKELLETLKCYLANDQSLKKTAFDLHIHINTLHYRLKQMKELTDIDPKSVKGITLFYLALSLLE